MIITQFIKNRFIAALNRKYIYGYSLHEIKIGIERDDDLFIIQVRHLFPSDYIDIIQNYNIDKIPRIKDFN